jgi:hypothetical protein
MEKQMTEENGYPEAWKPEPGASLAGTMTGVEMIDPNGQGAYPCVTIRSEDGQEHAVHAFHSVLKRELARRRPKPGDPLAIVYEGKKKGGAYGEYHSYRVQGGQPKEVNWDAMLPEDERQASSEPPIASSEPFVPPASFQPQPAPTGESFGDEPPF